MTQTDKDNIHNLVYKHDLTTLNIVAHLPVSMKNYELTQELLDLHCPSLETRADNIARQACWYAYLGVTESPDQDDFNNRVLPSALQKVRESISMKLSANVLLEPLVEILRIHSLNLTQVDKDRQVQ